MAVENKRQDIELIRVVGAFSIVWYHAGVIGHEVSYAGLVVFLILSIYLSGVRAVQNGVGLKRSYERLIVPWFFWFFIYGLLNLIFNKPIFSKSNGVVFGVLSGPSIHLWYLPFIFACLVCFAFFRIKFSRRSIAMVCAVGASAWLFATPLWRPWSVGVGYPITQYMHAMPGIFLGGFFACFITLSRIHAVLFAFLIFVSIVFSLGYEGVGVPYMIGFCIGALVALDVFKNYSFFDLSSVSSLMFGVYFVHIIVLASFNKIFFISGVFLPIVTFIVSTLFVFVMHKLPFRFFSRFS